jgi:hypothetical protein
MKNSNLDHCVVCPSIYGFWLLLWYRQTFLIFLCSNYFLGKPIPIMSGVLKCSFCGQIRGRMAILNDESLWRGTPFIADHWRTFLASLVTEFLEKESKMFLLIRCQVDHHGLLIVSNRYNTSSWPSDAFWAKLSDLMIAVVVLKGNIAFCGT